MSLIPKPALRIGVALTTLLALATASGQTKPCPIDGMRLPVPAPKPWNDAGGTDSDGCRWSIDTDGRWTVAGLDAVVACPKCHAAFLSDDLPFPLTKAQIEQVLQAVASVPPGSAEDPARRFRLAAATYDALGGARLGAAPVEPDAFLGELLLRGAWAARATAVLPDFDAAYRPRDLPQALAALEGLEARLRQGARERGGLDPLLLEVERLRSLTDMVDRLPGPAAASLSDRLTEALILLEQELYALREDLPDQQTARGSAEDRYVALVRACLRYGDPTRRRAWAESARARFGEVVEPRLQTLAAACAREAELLELAEARFARAAEAPGLAPARVAALLFLAGDCARRRGDEGTSTQRFQRVRVLAPGSTPGRRAVFLLGQN
jgi:hypothetical protein